MPQVRPCQRAVEILSFSSVENRRRPFSSAIFCLGLGVVLFAVGAKLALINRYGTDQPYADQWAAEGMYFVRGPLYYQVDLNQITALHGEHRPGLTRLWLRGLVLGNEGQWDCFVELVANLLIYGAFLTLVWQWVSRLTDRLWLGLAACLMTVMFGLPGIYENFLWGFQSCFLFMLLLGFVHITWTMEATRPSGRWWLAQLAGLMGLFSIAAGAMSAATLALIAGYEILRSRRNAWAWATLVTNVFLFVLGVWLLPGGGGHTGGMIVRLSGALVRTGYLLSWPFPGAWWGLLLQAPWVLLLTVARRGKGDSEESSGDWCVVAVAIWMTCSCFAIGYGRELSPETIGARYFDGLVLGLFVNFVVILRIVARLRQVRRVAWMGGGLVWIFAAGWGLWNYNLPEKLGPLFKYQHDLAIEQREIVRDFLVSDNPARLLAFANTTHRFPHMEYTLVFLRDPKVLPLLPPSLTPDGHAGPLSRLAVQIAAGCWFLLGLGVISWLAGMVWLRRVNTIEPRA